MTIYEMGEAVVLQADEEVADEPRTISTLSGMDLEEVVQSLRAADTLGLGIVVQNRWRMVADKSDEMTGEWVVTLLEDAPIAIDED
jgi:chaperonin GroEL (HSP60 family)